ncbi:MAG: DUF1987 domain-containing protein [Bacteroidia bacterium]
METLIIKETRTTPEIAFEPAKKTYSIRGRSIPADANSFFHPLDHWVDKYAEQASNSGMAVDINLEHLNTGSVRSLLMILAKLLRHKSAGNNIQINWHHEEQDEDLVDKGEEMSLILEHPFQFVPYKEEH